MNAATNSRDFEEKAAEFRKKFLIGAYSFFTVYLLYYVFFGKKVVYPNLIKIFILLSIGIIFYLVKRLKIEPLKDAGLRGRTSIKPGRAKDLSLLDMRDFGFNENTITKSRKLMQSQFNDPDSNRGSGQFSTYKDPREFIRPDINPYQFEQKSNVRESKLADVSRNEKSIFDHIPLDWPPNFSASRAKNYSARPFPSTYKDTNINGNLFGLQKDSSYSRLGINSVAIRRNPSFEIVRRTDSRIPQSKANYTLKKNSMVSKSDIRRDTMPQYDKITESDRALQTNLMAMNVSLEKFNVWAFHNIQVWFAYNFIPELLDRNMSNFEQINDQLRPSGRQLKEYLLMTKMLEEQGVSRQSQFQQMLHEGTFETRREGVSKQISIDDLLMGPEGGKFGELLGNRISLDRYLAPLGFRPDYTRMFVLKRLLSLKKENFLNSLENNQNLPTKNFPLDHEILLQAFVSYATEYDGYYALNPSARRNVFIEGFLRFVVSNEEDFHLEVSQKQIVCHVQKRSLPFIKNLNGVFSLVTFLTFYIKDRHWKYITNVPESAFKELLRRFDLSA